MKASMLGWSEWAMLLLLSYTPLLFFPRFCAMVAVMLLTVFTYLVHCNYLQAKQDIQDIIHAEMERLLNNPALKRLIIKKGE